MCLGTPPDTLFRGLSTSGQPRSEKEAELCPLERQAEGGDGAVSSGNPVWFPGVTWSCPQGTLCEVEGRHGPVLRDPSLRGETGPCPQGAQSEEAMPDALQASSLREGEETGPSRSARHGGLDMALFWGSPFWGGWRGQHQAKKPDRRTLPFTLQAGREVGFTFLPGCGSGRTPSAPGPRRGTAGQRGGSQDPAVTQPPRLPGEHFTTSPIPRRLLDGASKAIPGLYFIVTFICKGCQSGPGSRLPCGSSLSVTHTQRHPLTETHIQGPLGARRAPPETHRHAHVADAQTWGPASHHCPSCTGPCMRTRQGSQIVSRAHTHAHGSTPSVARGRPESQSPRAKGATSRPFPGKLAGDPPPPRPPGSLR